MARPKAVKTEPQFYEAFCLSCANPVEIHVKPHQARKPKQSDLHALTMAAVRALMDTKLVDVSVAVYKQRSKKKPRSLMAADKNKLRADVKKWWDERLRSRLPDSAKSGTG